jgi:glycerol-3-phosphate dehydrogenase
VARPRSAKAADEREVSRTFVSFDHAHDGVENFVTISGGKTTTARGSRSRLQHRLQKLGVGGRMPHARSGAGVIATTDN